MTGVASGVYVHFPYCAHRCHYCDFNVQTPRTIPSARYTTSVLDELAMRSPGWSRAHGAASTCYIGGGTPSLWPVAEVAALLTAIRGQVGLTPGAEVTLEANPGQITAPWLHAVAAAGVNRISLGAQALRDDLLATLTRRHTADDVTLAIARIGRAALASWSVDLIFGIAGQTLEAWQDDVRRVVDLGPPHLSVYSLTVEPRTLLDRDIRRGSAVAPDANLQADMLLAGKAILEGAGYVHYEVSSYALPGHLARHNSAYWSGAPYLALGAGAHGFDGSVRYRNLARVRRYQQALGAGALPEEERECLTPEIQAFERVMTGLRRLDIGVDVGSDWTRFGVVLEGAARRGLVSLDGRRARLTPEGMLLMDHVLLSLLEGDHGPEGSSAKPSSA